MTLLVQNRGDMGTMTLVQGQTKEASEANGQQPLEIQFQRPTILDSGNTRTSAVVFQAQPTKIRYDNLNIVQW